MHLTTKPWAVVAFMGGAVLAQSQSMWGRCGGSGYEGPRQCPRTAICYSANPWYSQCQPIESGIGQPGNPIVITTTVQTTITVVPGPRPTVITTRFTYLTPSPTLTPDPQFTVIDGITYSIIRPRTSSAPPQFTVINGVTYSVIRPLAADPTGAPVLEARLPHLDNPDRNIPRAPAAAAAANPIMPRAPTPTILAEGQYWIRAVAPPNYHKYLQTNPTNVAGQAILGAAGTAGQFSIQDGQLVEATGSGSPALYLHVERPAVLTDPPQRALATWFNTTKNDFGVFAWQGDSLIWTTTEVKRQNAAAWLVCRDQGLFVNTGAYAYQTPVGCVDQTIHYYNDKTANDLVESFLV
ncbi:hypothetical protein MCOR25_011235 [Pyricularia grisea]|nr:hypothetical protein MCOR25_011235 [Pyricularia grisea]